MKISDLLIALDQARKDHGDLLVLLADPKNEMGAYDINRGDIKRTGDQHVLVLVPNAKGITQNNAFIKQIGVNHNG